MLDPPTAFAAAVLALERATCRLEDVRSLTTRIYEYDKFGCLVKVDLARRFSRFAAPFISRNELVDIVTSDAFEFLCLY